MSDMGVKYDVGPPPWSEAPEWANWLAMNPNGKWGWHNAKPVKGAQKWLWHATDSWSRTARGYVSDVHGRGWAETLEPRPTNTGDDWPGHVSPCAGHAAEQGDVDRETQRLFAKAVQSGEVSVTEDVPGYESLRRVLDAAYEQAARGKGRERHALDGAGFDNQPMQRLIDAHGLGFATGQACKKAEEALYLDHDAMRAELLGAIVYLAGAIVWIDRKEVA